MRRSVLSDETPLFLLSKGLFLIKTVFQWFINRWWLVYALSRCNIVDTWRKNSRRQILSRVFCSLRRFWGDFWSIKVHNISLFRLRKKMSQRSKLSIFYRLLPAALLLMQSRAVIQTKMCHLKRKKVELSARDGLKTLLGYSILTVCRRRKPLC